MATRVLDLGCGDGRLAALVLDACPGVVEAIGIDNSPLMLELARTRFLPDDRVGIIEHDLAEALPIWHTSTATGAGVVSRCSSAAHPWLSHARQRDRAPWERWDAAERLHFSALRPRASFDLIVSGGS